MGSVSRSWMIGRRVMATAISIALAVTAQACADGGYQPVWKIDKVA